MVQCVGLCPGDVGLLEHLVIGFSSVLSKKCCLTNCEGGGFQGGKTKLETTPNSSEAVLVSLQSQEEKQKTNVDSTALSPGY